MARNSMLSNAPLAESPEDAALSVLEAAERAEVEAKHALSELEELSKILPMKLREARDVVTLAHRDVVLAKRSAVPDSAKVIFNHRLRNPADGVWFEVGQPTYTMIDSWVHSQIEAGLAKVAVESVSVEA